MNGDQLTRFLIKISIDKKGCWLWTDYLNKDGYGQFWLNGTNHRAPRVAYEHFRDTIPEGLQIDHLCRVRSCVNPWHLEAVTPKVNTNRGNGNTAAVAASAARRSAQTHCKRGHPLSGGNLTVSHGRRHCKRCRADATARHRKQGETV